MEINYKVNQKVATRSQTYEIKKRQNNDKKRVTWFKQDPEH